MQEYRSNSSVVRRSGTTSSRVPAVRVTSNQQRNVPARQSLTADQLRVTQQKTRRTTDRNSDRQVDRQSHDVSSINTVRMGNQPYISQEWADTDIPVYSRAKEKSHALLLLGTGMIVMICLLMFAMFLKGIIVSTVNHAQYGDHPVTHFVDHFDIIGQDPHKLTNIIGVNENGVIVILVVTSDPSKTKSYVMPAYTDFPTDSVPFISKSEIQGSPAIEVQVDNTVWYLVLKNGQFMPAQL